MQKELIEYIKLFQRHEKDNGSPEVQIALLTLEIQKLQEHISKHTKDVDAKRALLKKVARRKKFLNYLKENDITKYIEVSKKLKIK